MLPYGPKSLSDKLRAARIAKIEQAKTGHPAPSLAEQRSNELMRELEARQDEALKNRTEVAE